jgi:GxxExxY protein
MKIVPTERASAPRPLGSSGHSAEADKLNRITDAIIGSAIAVHKALGPGLLESAYEACLTFELSQRGFKVEQQKPLPVVYRDVRSDCGYRIDLLVEDSVIVEIKSVDSLLPIHHAQLLSYLRLSDRRVGLLIDFNVRAVKDAISRVVNHFPEGSSWGQSFVPDRL